ncbi:SDR family oxidoreductase [Legionella israelensis]|nr:SDR family oxidoreductase [Legionella israelensis]
MGMEDDMKKLENKTVLITGASSGIGFAFAQLLAEYKMKLVITARQTDKLNTLAEQLRKKGADVQVFTCDLSKKGAANLLYQQIQEANIAIDLLINNAGFGKWGEFLDFDLETYNNMLQLNINALTELCYLFIPHMIKAGSGGIINVASLASFTPVPYATVYSASKSYVLFFTEALSGEYKDKGLHIMALCPGGTESNFAKVAAPHLNYEKGDFDSAEFVAQKGLEAFLQGKRHVVIGKKNKTISLLPRFLSRKSIINIVGKAWKKRINL